MSAGRTDTWFAAVEAAIVLAADIIIVLVLQRSQVFEATGVSPGWWGVVGPAVLACLLASVIARGTSITAMPIGPNAVFVMAFTGVIAPLSQELCVDGGTQGCALELAGFFGAALAVYALVVAACTSFALRLDLQDYRRVLLMPLAAVCWTYLVITPAIRVAHEPIAVMLPAILLYALLLAGVRKLIPWLAAGTLWAALAFATQTFPHADSVNAATLPAFALGTSWTWLTRPLFWMETLPIVVPLAIANALGIIENLAAAREVGDSPSASRTLGVVTGGTLAAAVLGGNAPMTVYVGHAAFQKRGAGWAYSLLAIPPLVLIGVFGNALVDKLPTAIFLGAVAYLGSTVGLLPRRYIASGIDGVRFVVVVLPVFVAGVLGASNPVLAWIGRGGGLVSVAWSFFCFAPPGSRTREISAWAMAVGSVVGLTHAQPFSVLAYVTGAAYAAVAVALMVRRRTRQ